jgi:hypothetical protein
VRPNGAAALLFSRRAAHAQSRHSSGMSGVRVAGRLPGAGDGKKFVVWGHSQAGHAALFTGMIAKTYAPDLDPATDGRLVLDGFIGMLTMSDLQSGTSRAMHPAVRKRRR